MKPALLLAFLALAACSSPPSAVIEREVTEDAATTAPLAGEAVAAIVAITPAGELCAMHPESGEELARTPAGVVEALGSSVLARTLWAVRPDDDEPGKLVRFELGPRGFVARRTLTFHGASGVLAAVDPVPVGFSFDEGTTLFRGATTFLPWSRPSSMAVVPSRDGPRLLALVDTETPWILTSATLRSDGLAPHPDVVLPASGGHSSRLVALAGEPHIVSASSGEITLLRDGIVVATTATGPGVDIEDAVEVGGTVVALLGPAATLVRLDGGAPPLRLGAVVGHTPWPTRRLVSTGDRLWVAADTRAVAVDVGGGRLDLALDHLPCEQAIRMTLVRSAR